VRKPYPTLDLSINRSAAERGKMTNGEKKGIVVELIDGLHPNGAGYQSMAGLWDNALP